MRDVLAEALRGFGIELVLEHFELWMSIVNSEVRVDILEERWPRLRRWSEIITRLLGECTECGNMYPAQKTEDGDLRPVGTDGTCTCGNEKFELAI